jgi:hypothetical protein
LVRLLGRLQQRLAEDDQTVGIVDRVDLDQAIRRLPQRQRFAVALYYLEGAVGAGDGRSDGCVGGFGQDPSLPGSRGVEARAGGVVMDGDQQFRELLEAAVPAETGRAEARSEIMRRVRAVRLRRRALRATGAVAAAAAGLVTSKANTSAGRAWMVPWMRIPARTRAQTSA